MHENATKCNETIGKWCKNKHGASKIIDTFETYQGAQRRFQLHHGCASSLTHGRRIVNQLGHVDTERAASPWAQDAWRVGTVTGRPREDGRHALPVGQGPADFARVGRACHRPQLNSVDMRHCHGMRKEVTPHLSCRHANGSQPDEMLGQVPVPIDEWYVANVSIIFDASCLFYTNCCMFCLHFVAFLCIF
jgi:hypothetical protein